MSSLLKLCRSTHLKIKTTTQEQHIHAETLQKNCSTNLPNYAQQRTKNNTGAMYKRV